MPSSSSAAAGVRAMMFSVNLKACTMKLSKRSKQWAFQNLMKPFKEDNLQKRPVIEWVIGNTSEHFAEHREYIERAAKANKS